MGEEPSAPCATTLDAIKKTALSTTAPTASSCDHTMMKTNVSTILNTQDLPLSSRSHHHPFPSELHHQKPLKNLISLQTDKPVVLCCHLMESTKGDKKGRNLNGRDSKRMLTEAWSENLRKWTNNMTKNSKLSKGTLTIKKNTMKKLTITSLANQATSMIFSSQVEFRI